MNIHHTEHANSKKTPSRANSYSLDSSIIRDSQCVLLYQLTAETHGISWASSISRRLQPRCRQQHRRPPPCRSTRSPHRCCRNTSPWHRPRRTFWAQPVDAGKRMTGTWEVYNIVSNCTRHVLAWQHVKLVRNVWLCVLLWAGVTLSVAKVFLLFYTPLQCSYSDQNITSQGFLQNMYDIWCLLRMTLY